LAEPTVTQSGSEPYGQVGQDDLKKSEFWEHSFYMDCTELDFRPWAISGQETSGLNPDTPTKNPVTANVVAGFFFVSGFERPAPVRTLMLKVSGGLGQNRPQNLV